MEIQTMSMRGRTQADEEELWAEAEIMIAPGGPLSPGEAVDLGAEHADESEDDARDHSKVVDLDDAGG